MDIVTTSLEALIQRATCNQNQCPDTAAIDAFCGLVSKEPDCAQTATRFITAKVHSLQEWEALQALHVLDSCMKRCGSNFHAEVGKFRFLNELIKLVSPKYNGAHTPEPVKRRVLELMQSWTVYYPREFKIKEAYEMLKKQGVVKENDTHKTLEQNILPPPPPRHEDSIFQDTEKSRLLQKLLQSKNPDDLQAANRLIKTMVKEDERRVEMKSRHLSELEAAHNNARLLSEMLDSYNREVSSVQDLELINELQASCLTFRLNAQKLLSEGHNDETIFNEVLMANEELSEVLDKYSAVVIQGLPAVSVGANLLDLTPSEESLPPPQPPTSVLCDHLAAIGIDGPVGVVDSVIPLQLLPSSAPPQPSLSMPQSKCDLASLEGIFSSLALPATTSLSPLRTASVTERPVTMTGLEELDAISKNLLKQSLPPTATQPMPKAPVKVPMNQLPLSHQASPVHSTALHSTPTLKPVDSLDIDLLIGSMEDLSTEQPQVNGDATVVDITPSLEITLPQVSETPTAEVKTETHTPVKREEPVKPLGDLTVSLASIKPGSMPPLTVMDERGVSVTIHFARDCPRPDVSVFVVTTTSQSQFPITDYLFQAIVPKGCRLRLQPPSSTELPAHNPFLPPAAITQVLLIASPAKEAILLRVVVSFTMDDETVTEMKEVEKFPLLNS